jgi:hypothetical protein
LGEKLNCIPVIFQIKRNNKPITTIERKFIPSSVPSARLLFACVMSILEVPISRVPMKRKAPCGSRKVPEPSIIRLQRPLSVIPEQNNQ